MAKKSIKEKLAEQERELAEAKRRKGGRPRLPAGRRKTLVSFRIPVEIERRILTENGSVKEYFLKLLRGQNPEFVPAWYKNDPAMINLDDF
jgi:hypothetical protein